MKGAKYKKDSYSSPFCCAWIISWSCYYVVFGFDVVKGYSALLKRIA